MAAISTGDKAAGGETTDLSGARAAYATQRAKWRGLGQRLYHNLNSLFHLHPADFVAVLWLIGKWGVIGGVIGVLAGSASAVFLISLTWATQTRLVNPWLLWLLPWAGLGLGWIYFRFGGTAVQGNNLVIDEVNQNRSRIPLRMAPFVLLGTVVTHLFGGSAGREGTAIQMGASLADAVQRALRLNQADRRMSIMAGISGGFGSVFGVPMAGAIFGMEVQGVGRIRYEGLVPCLVASYVGDLVTRAWGVPHAHYPQLAHLEIAPGLLLKIAVAGVAFGLTSLIFVELIHGIKRLLALTVSWPPLKLFVGGVVVILLTLLVDTRDYLGLSLPLIEHTMDGTGVVPYAFAFKLLFTAVTLGAGYLGGEVTPLFVIGSTLGYALGTWLGVDPTLLAAIGLLAVFAGASNTPLACAVMGVELFGGGAALYFLLGTTMAYLASGHRGIYSTQVVQVPKFPTLEVEAGETLLALLARRAHGWLPPLAHLDTAVRQKPVRALMTIPAIAVLADATAAEMVTRALTSGTRTIPIIDRQQRVVGIVTDRDLQRSGLNVTLSLLRQMTAAERTEIMARLAQLSVRALMTQPVITIAASAPLGEAIDLFIQRDLKRLPVVDAHGVLVGMITRSDLLREIAFANSVGSAGLDRDTLQVGDIDLLPALVAPENMALAQALQMMRAAQQLCLVVTDVAGRVVGMVTLSDLLLRVPVAERTALLSTLTGDAVPVEYGVEGLFVQSLGEVMTAPVVTITPECTVSDALRLLLEHRIKRLPVVDAQGNLLGLVGRMGLLHGLFAVPSGHDDRI